MLEQRRRDVNTVRTASHYNPFERFCLWSTRLAGAARRQRLGGAEQCCCSECCSSHLGSSPASYHAARCGLPRCTGHDQSYQSCVAKTTTRAVWRARLQLSALACLLVSLQASSGARGRVSPPEKALRCTRHRCIKRRKLVDGNLKELSCHQSRKAITRPLHSRVHSDARRCTASLSCYLIAAI